MTNHVLPSIENNAGLGYRLAGGEVWYQEGGCRDDSMQAEPGVSVAHSRCSASTSAESRVAGEVHIGEQQVEQPPMKPWPQSFSSET
jgi:hypothetical protein